MDNNLVAANYLINLPFRKT